MSQIELFDVTKDINFNGKDVRREIRSIKIKMNEIIRHINQMEEDPEDVDDIDDDDDLTALDLKDIDKKVKKLK